MVNEIITYSSIVISIIAILSSWFLIYLQFQKEKKTKLYLRKLDFYEKLINHFNLKFFQEDDSKGKDTIKLYHLSFIFASDDVIKSLNKYFEICNNRKIIPNVEIKEKWFNEFVINCRKDLEITTKLNKCDYQAP